MEDLNAQFDFAKEASNFKELISRWPKLPEPDMDQLPSNLRRKHERFIQQVAVMTFTG